jgi:hypothetical protein
MQKSSALRVNTAEKSVKLKEFFDFFVSLFIFAAKLY